jgi:hypothetical protein
MPTFTLQDVANDPDLAEEWTVIRNSGAFMSGSWQATESVLPFYGVTNVDEPYYIEMIAEGDRVHGARLFISECRMYVTSELRQDGTSGTSDVIVWHGVKYRVHSVGDYSDRGGFFIAVSQRMQGS